FGAPVAKGRVDAHISSVPLDYTPPNTDDFIVDDHAYLRDLRNIHRNWGAESATWELDDRGKLSHRIELNRGQPRTAQYLMLEADVQDLTRQTQAGRGRVLVHPAEYYVGFQRPKDRFLAIG